MIEIANDILSEALGLMRITGSLLLVETYRPPWGIAIPDQAALSQLLHVPKDTQVIAFHFVHQGSFELDSATVRHKLINTGDVVVSFGGLAHRLSQGEPSSLVSLEAHLTELQNRFERPTGTEQPYTALICGVFLLRDTQLNPLFAALPTFLYLQRTRLAEAGLSFTSTDLLIREMSQRDYGTDYAVQRLLELLCVDTIRSYMSTTDDTSHNWFRGIKDPLMGKALYAFHRAPHDAWSVARLAGEVNLSPSRFAARFVEAFGESSMSYVTKWRLNVARNLLWSTDKSVEEIAHCVGYHNLPAFIRVFRRHLGIAPTAWRNNRPINLS